MALGDKTIAKGVGQGPNREPAAAPIGCPISKRQAPPGLMSNVTLQVVIVADVIE